MSTIEFVPDTTTAVLLGDCWSKCPRRTKQIRWPKYDRWWSHPAKSRRYRRGCVTSMLRNSIWPLHAFKLVKSWMFWNQFHVSVYLRSFFLPPLNIMLPILRYRCHKISRRFLMSVCLALVSLKPHGLEIMRMRGAQLHHSHGLKSLV
jgi:hypothetical protein